MKKSLSSFKNVPYFVKGILLLMSLFCSLQCYRLSAGEAVNLLDNPGAETQIPASQAVTDFSLNYFLNNDKLDLSDTVPEGWGLFASADTKVKWGSSDKEFHSGKFSCFLTLVDPLKMNQAWLFERILLGKAGNAGGKFAIKVAPNTEYTYSFWVKGDIEKFCVEVFTWNTDEGNKSGMKVAYTNRTEETVGAEWKQITGNIKPAADAKRMAVGIRILAAKPGQSIFVDDAVISVKAAAEPVK